MMIESCKVERKPPIATALKELERCVDRCAATMAEIESRLSSILTPVPDTNPAPPCSKEPSPELHGILLNSLDCRIRELGNLETKMHRIAERLEV